MKPYYEAKGIAIYHGDCRQVLPLLKPAESCISDPPYGISFMGRGWDRGVPGVEFWKVILNALRPGASLLAFGGTRTWHRLACAIEDAGFEARDCLMWLYGAGFPKALDISKAIDKAAGERRQVVGVDLMKAGRLVNQIDGGGHKGTWQAGKRNIHITTPATDAAKLWNGWGTALKPAWEPILLSMRPTDGTFVENAAKHGVAGLNIEGTRIAGPKGNGHWSGEDSDDQKSKPGYEGGLSTGGMKHPAGRWPANLLLDEQAARLLDEQSGTLRSGDGTFKRNSAMGFKGNAYGAESRPADQEQISYGDSGGASRFFYVAKANPADRGTREYSALPLFGVEASRDTNDHPTVKPIELMRYLCLLTKTPTGGTVLDPFMGSGTTLLAARAVGRPAVGVEIEERYCEIAAKRLSQPATDV
jgi:site-specific DNA-methyltransferase (adenine-specific)